MYSMIKTITMRHSTKRKQSGGVIPEHTGTMPPLPYGHTGRLYFFLNTRNLLIT